MIDKGDKSALILEINSLIKYNNSSSDISPSLLKYFELEELISIRDSLLGNKKFLREETVNWFDELYEKTKKDD